MVAPDAAMIARVILVTQGFAHAESLSHRVTTLFRACLGGASTGDAAAAGAATLSRQSHYDFGLRALKTVLTTAGTLLRRKRGSSAGGATPAAQLTPDAESALLIRAVAESVVPKLVPGDVPVFTHLLLEAFPPPSSAGSSGDASHLSAALAGSHSALLAAAVRRVAAARRFVCSNAAGGGWVESDADGIIWQQATSPVGAAAPPGASNSSLAASLAHIDGDEADEPAGGAAGEGSSSTAGAAGSVGSGSGSGGAGGWFSKVMQLYTSACTRHGIMMVGPPGSGKTAALRVLCDALSLVDGVKNDVTVIDAKAFPVPMAAGSSASAQAQAQGFKEQLYGRLDPATFEWKDGLFTAVLRAIASSERGESGRRHWVVLDGDLDPEWAEVSEKVHAHSGNAVDCNPAHRPRRTACALLMPLHRCLSTPPADAELAAG